MVIVRLAAAVIAMAASCTSSAVHWGAARPTPIAVVRRTEGPAAIPRATPPQVPSPAPTPVPSPAGAPSGRILPVPLFAQVLNLSCEAASLQMALAYGGRPVGQRDLLAAMRPDYSRPVLQGSTVVSWTDPYDHFVGDPAGHEYDHTGYGVYYPVVARVAGQFGARVAWSGTGLSWERLSALVISGRPVIVWLAYDGSAYRQSGPFYDYRATDGRDVPYAPGYEHTVTVAGISGESVLVNNPRWGHRDWLARQDLLNAMAPFGGMAVALDQS